MLILAAGNSVELSETAEAVTAVIVLSTSAMVSGILVVPFVYWVEMSAMVGASFTAVMVTVKVDDAVKLPSLTVRVMVTVPLWLLSGVTVTVRFSPVPPRVIFASGTTVVSEEVAVTVKLDAAVLSSDMVKARTPVSKSSLMLWVETVEMLGAVLLDPSDTEEDCEAALGSST